MHEHFIRFDFTGHEWIFDFQRLDDFSFSSSLLDLFARQMQQVRPEIRFMLQVAACLGNANISAKVLMHASGKSHDDVCKYMMEASRCKLIFPVDEGHRDDSVDSPNDHRVQRPSSRNRQNGDAAEHHIHLGIEDDRRWRFYHDRVQQGTHI